MVNSTYIVDTSFWVGLTHTQDPHHNQADTLFSALNEQQAIFETNNLILFETYTVLVNRSKNLDTARGFRQWLGKSSATIAIENLTPTDQDTIMKDFLNQQKYHGGWLSMWDCAVVHQARQAAATGIITFDQGFRQFAGEREIVGLETGD